MSTTITEIRSEIEVALAELEGQIEPLREALVALGPADSNGSTAPAPAPAAKPSAQAPVAPAATPTPAPARRRPSGRGAAKYTDEAILDIVAAHGKVGAGAIRERLGGSSNQLSMRLRKLVDNGNLIRTGERRATEYQLPTAA